ncbi:MAG: endonuclease/exonuclease/phosphatase family protein [Bacteroides sp.]|nr:endonuclease/exonuclease/phosphatase family protein [Bacteroides sp.]MCM1086428.1 endonuclease/exonuclease/phosphatase family protein [Bacteroides sp.]MCM1168772.1 endonuclease/exonuclease/phosphatase family protein [Bacteroides sp.]
MRTILKSLTLPGLTACLFLLLNFFAGGTNVTDTLAPSRRKAPTPLESTLSGTVTGNQYVKSSDIKSTQVIESGKTTYLAEEEIVLGPEFTVRDGATFEAGLDRDSFHIVNILTYNLWVKSNASHKTHGRVIKDSKADVVSVQEVLGKNNFETMKDACGYKGDMCITEKQNSKNYGIGMLWNPDVVGEPVAKEHKLIKITQGGEDRDEKRAFIVAEFRDFCFVATHFSLNQDKRNEMAGLIVAHSIVTRCIQNGKPVYIAGDMNEGPDKPAITLLKNNGFRVLNEMGDDHVTFPGGGDDMEKYIDLILEYNKTPYNKKIDCGIPLSEDEKDNWKTSDHYPYFVKVKTQ